MFSQNPNSISPCSPKFGEIPQSMEIFPLFPSFPFKASSGRAGRRLEEDDAPRSAADEKPGQPRDLLQSSELPGRAARPDSSNRDRARPRNRDESNGYRRCTERTRNERQAAKQNHSHAPEANKTVASNEMAPISSSVTTSREKSLILNT